MCCQTLWDAFSDQYLKEPWYEILTQWDEMEIEDEDEDEWSEQNEVSLDVLVKRSADESFSVVNWQLSKHNGRWLTDSLSIN